MKTKNHPAPAPEAPGVLTHPYLTRPLGRATRYPLLRKILDRRAGVIDGRLDRITNRSAWDDEADEATQAVTMWLARLRSVYLEETDVEHADLLAVQAGPRARLDYLTGVLADQQAEQAAALVAREAVADNPDDQELTSRGVVEQDDPVEVIRARRTAEHRARVVAPAQQRLDAARAAVESTKREIVQTEAILAAAHDVAVARVDRIADFHERRGSVYRRAYMNAWQHGSANSGDVRVAPAALRAPRMLSLPAWARQHLTTRHGEGAVAPNSIEPA